MNFVNVYIYIYIYIYIYSVRDIFVANRICDLSSNTRRRFLLEKGIKPIIISL